MEITKYKISKKSVSVRYNTLIHTRCGYEVAGMILLQAYLCTYSLLRGGHLRSTPLEQLCTYPNDAATDGNISQTPAVE
jgi:hypothetical protein